MTNNSNGGKCVQSFKLDINVKYGEYVDKNRFSYLSLETKFHF